MELEFGQDVVSIHNYIKYTQVVVLHKAVCVFMQKRKRLHR